MQLWLVVIKTSDNRKIRHVVDAKRADLAIKALKMPANLVSVSVHSVSGDVIRSEEEEMVDLSIEPQIGF